MKIRTGPAGIHLFERKSGLNVLLDELVVPASAWALAPRFVSIALTNACDLSCRHCYAPKHAATLNAKRVMSWLAELDCHGCLAVGFGGGEPTLHSGLPDLCRFVVRSTQMAVSFTTHAHRLSDALISSLVGNIHFVRVSMDGVGQTYEEIRGRPFNSLVKRIATLASCTRFGINYLVNARTLPDLDEAIQFATAAGASEFLLLPERSTCNTIGVDSQTTDYLHRWVKSFRGAIRLSISYADAEGLPTCDPLKVETGLRAYAFISADGELKRSSFHDSGIRVGAGGLMKALSDLEDPEISQLV